MKKVEQELKEYTEKERATTTKKREEFSCAHLSHRSSPA
jgi:hypothetical protein